MVETSPTLVTIELIDMIPIGRVTPTSSRSILIQIPETSGLPQALPSPCRNNSSTRCQALPVHRSWTSALGRCSTLQPTSTHSDFIKGVSFAPWLFYRFRYPMYYFYGQSYSKLNRIKSTYCSDSSRAFGQNRVVGRLKPSSNLDMG